MRFQLWLNDADGKFSATRTAFIYGFALCSLKLLVSGVVIKGISLGAMSGVEYGAAIAALGGVYVLNKNNDNSRTNG